MTVDKDSILSVTPLLCATVGVCAGLAVFAVHPDQGPAIKDAVSSLLLLCGTAWQASRSLKTPS